MGSLNSWILHSCTKKPLPTGHTQHEEPHVQSHPPSGPETKTKVNLPSGTFFPSDEPLLCPMLALPNAAPGLSGVGCGEGVEVRGGWTAEDRGAGAAAWRTPSCWRQEVSMQSQTSVLPVSCPVSRGLLPLTFPVPSPSPPSKPAPPPPTSQDWPGPAASLGSPGHFPSHPPCDPPCQPQAHILAPVARGHRILRQGHGRSSTCLWLARARIQPWLLSFVLFCVFR